MGLGAVWRVLGCLGEVLWRFGVVLEGREFQKPEKTNEFFIVSGNGVVARKTALKQFWALVLAVLGGPGGGFGAVLGRSWVVWGVLEHAWAALGRSSAVLA